MKIFRKYLVIGIIILIIGVSVVPCVCTINPKMRQSNGNTKIKIADIYTRWDEFGGCTEVNITCYNHNVTWSADNLGTVRGWLMYINWSWEILKTELFLPRLAPFYMHVIDIDRGAWIPFVYPQFYIEWLHLWRYGSGNFTKNIFISFNSRGRENVPLDAYVKVRGIPKSIFDNSTYIDSCTSHINVTIGK